MDGWVDMVDIENDEGIQVARSFLALYTFDNVFDAPFQ